jgi:hypothetical protein
MKRWISSSNAMISTTSIFASLCVALVGFLVALNDGSWMLQGCALFSLVAFMLFAYTAEMITDALERNKVLLYVRAHAAYNLGVVMMLLSIALILYAKGPPFGPVAHSRYLDAMASRFHMVGEKARSRVE